MVVIQKAVYLHCSNEAANRYDKIMTISQLKSFATAKGLNVDSVKSEHGFDTFHCINFGRGNKIYWFSSYDDSGVLRFENTYNKNTGRTERLFADSYRVKDSVEYYVFKCENALTV